ncbi:MAG: methyltransferase [Verrucomicrobiota bacterium]|nr:methyltransferase [Verrucomicrobiota bacterium]
MPPIYQLPRRNAGKSPPPLSFIFNPPNLLYSYCVLTDLTLLPSSDPTSVYRYRDGLYAADLLTTALVHLDLFTWIDANPGSSLEKISHHFNIHPRPTDVMLTLFVAMELLLRQGSDYKLTTLGREFLTRSSHWDIAPYFASLKERPVCKDFLHILQTNKTANWGSYKDEKDWHKAMETPEFAKNFTAAMDCRGVYLAAALARKIDCRNHARLLDIGGGSGIYACSFVAHYSHLTATVFEKSPVDRIARDSISSRGFSDRVNALPGDLFHQPLPPGYDLHLISNVLHDWDLPEVKRIVKTSAESISPRGMLIVHDAFLNREKTGPLPVAAYSTLLMHSTEGRCYSIAEIESVLAEFGFAQFTFHETAADRGAITAIMHS